MRKMKASGIEWIGEIPEGWEVLAHKYIMHKEKSICEHYSGEDVISLTLNGVVKRDLENPSGKMPTTFDGYQFVDPNDLLLCLFDIDVTPRCVGLVKDYGVTSPAYSRFKMHSGFCNAYYNYLLRFIDDEKVFVHLSKNLRSSLTESDFGAIKTIVPPKAEQQRIADYLDNRTFEIDTLLSKARSSIEEYKKLKQAVITQAVTKGVRGEREMKDSGIEWAGLVPLHWGVAKIGSIGQTSSGATPLRSKEASFFDDAAIRWVRTLDLNDGLVYDSSEKITELALASSACSLMPKGTVCVAMYGGAGTIGKCGLLMSDCATNQAVCSIVCNREIVSPIFLLMQLLALKSYWMKYAVGTRKDPNISQDVVARMKILIPPLDEQKEITDYLDAKCAEIDRLIAKKEQLVKELESYKKSLIYEVVTGKREV